MSNPVPPPPASKPSTPWPGFDFGLPEHGPRSVARLGRRILGLAIDWILAVIVSVAFFHYNGWATLGVFAAIHIVFGILLGGSVGHLILRMRVVPLAGGPTGVWRPIVRTVLICLVIPAVIYDQDQRGLHDRAIGAVLVRV